MKKLLEYYPFVQLNNAYKAAWFSKEIRRQFFVNNHANDIRIRGDSIFHKGLNKEIIVASGEEMTEQVKRCNNK